MYGQDAQSPKPDQGNDSQTQQMQQAEPQSNPQPQTAPQPEAGPIGLNKPRSKRMILVVVGLLVLAVILIVALLTSGGGARLSSTVSTLPSNSSLSINLAGANESLLNVKDIEGVFGTMPANNPDYANFSNPSLLGPAQTSSSCNGGERYYGSLFETNSNAFTNRTLRSELKASLPIDIYSSYVVLSSSEFNFSKLAGDCPSKTVAVGRQYEENFSMVNVSSIIGAPAVLFVQKNLTSAGLAAVGVAYNGSPPATSFYFLKFKYKNSIWTVGEYVFANNTAEPQILNLSKVLYSKLLQNKV